MLASLLGPARFYDWLLASRRLAGHTSTRPLCLSLARQAARATVEGEMHAIDIKQKVDELVTITEVPEIATRIQKKPYNEMILSDLLV